MKLEHYYSDFNGRQLSKSAYNEKPSNQTVQQAMTLGSITVGNADIICQEGKYLVVIVAPSNGLTRNTYRDMYRIVA